MKLLLVGKMTGLEDWGAKEFDFVKEKLLAMGHEVLSPVDQAREKNFAPLSKREIIETFLKNVSESDGIVVLDNWENSPGASIEVALASYMGVPIWKYVPDILVRLVLDLRDLVRYEPCSFFFRKSGKTFGSYAWREAETKQKTW